MWTKIGAAEQDDADAAAEKDKKIKDQEAQLINLLTKDIDVFVNGSWQFPYLVAVPVNTVVSAIILGQMYGNVIILCYLCMAALLLLQYYSNKKLAALQFQHCQVTDQRIALISNIIKGIKQVKMRLQENQYIKKIIEIRTHEMQIYGQYVNIKQVCSALYFNAGVIISAIIFSCADPATLGLGKVFSTMALLGYVFNFSVLYSNYAIEALYTIAVFNKRVDQIVLKA